MTTLAVGLVLMLGASVVAVLYPWLGGRAAALAGCGFFTLFLGNAASGMWRYAVPELAPDLGVPTGPTALAVATTLFRLVSMVGVALIVAAFVVLAQRLRAAYPDA